MEEWKLSRMVLGRAIQVWAIPLDQGLHVLVAGGDRSHVGAVSGAGYPAGRARDQRAEAVREKPETDGGAEAGLSGFRELLPPQTLVFGTHKEGAVTERWARELAAFLGTSCTVACGIHYDGLSPEGLKQVMEALEDLLEALKEKLRPL